MPVTATVTATIGMASSIERVRNGAATGIARQAPPSPAAIARRPPSRDTAASKPRERNHASPTETVVQNAQRLMRVAVATSIVAATRSGKEITAASRTVARRLVTPTGSAVGERGTPGVA